MTTTKKGKVKLSDRVIDHFIAAVLIFASVFLAFWLTERRETKNSEKALKTSLKQIASEMTYNHRRVETVYEYHLKLISEIDSLRKNTNKDWEKLDGSVLANWRGIQLPSLRSTAYQTFLNSSINNKGELQLLKSLADIYNIQSIIERLDNSVFDIAIADKKLFNLSKIRHLVEIYTGILPDVMIQYQHGRKNWFYEYGYDLEVSSGKLKEEVNSRTSGR